MTKKTHPLAEIFDNSSMIEYMIKLEKENRCPHCYVTLRPMAVIGALKKDLICGDHGAIFPEEYLEAIRKVNDKIFEFVTDLILNYECFDKQPIRDLLVRKETLQKEREGKP